MSGKELKKHFKKSSAGYRDYITRNILSTMLSNKFKDNPGIHDAYAYNLARTVGAKRELKKYYATTGALLGAGFIRISNKGRNLRNAINTSTKTLQDISDSDLSFMIEEINALGVNKIPINELDKKVV